MRNSFHLGESDKVKTKGRTPHEIKSFGTVHQTGSEIITRQDLSPQFVFLLSLSTFILSNGFANYTLSLINRNFSRDNVLAYFFSLRREALPLVFFICATAFYIIMKVQRTHGLKQAYRKRAFGGTGTVRFARPEEIESRLVKVSRKDPYRIRTTGLVLGSDQTKAEGELINGRYQITSTNCKNFYLDTYTTNTIVLGTTRSGKGELLINHQIKTLLASKDQPSIIVNDPKGELYAFAKPFIDSLNKEIEHNPNKDQQCFGHSRKPYNVLIYNLRDPSRSAKYNPLFDIAIYMDDTRGRVAEQEKADLLCKDYCQLLCDDPNAKEKIWSQSSQALLQAMIMFLILNAKDKAIFEANGDPMKVAIDPKTQHPYWCNAVNMHSVYNFFAEHGADAGESLDTIMTSIPLDHPARLAYQTSKFSKKETRSSIFTNLSSNLIDFSDRGIQSLSSRSEIAAKNLITHPTILFMIIPDEIKSRSVQASLFVNQMYTSLVQESLKFPKNKLPRRIYFMLDEFGNMGKIPNFEQKVSVALGREILFTIFVQSLAQLDLVYTELTRKVLLDNFGTQIYVNALNYDTNDHFSKMFGETVHNTLQQTFTESTNMLASYNVAEASRRLLNADELSRLSFGEIIVLIQRQYPMKFQMPPFSLEVTQLADLESIPKDDKPAPLYVYTPNSKLIPAVAIYENGLRISEVQYVLSESSLMVEDDRQTKLMDKLRERRRLIEKSKPSLYEDDIAT